MIRTAIAVAAGLAFATGIPIVPAQAAGAARTFVSAAGSDSNNCVNVATPCRHLATAYAATAANGEIYVLDPANYGSLTITGPVSIEGHGWASIAPVSGSAAITINANTGDKINIIGVVLDGTAVANSPGIQFNSGGSLTVRDSVIRNFSGTGIYFVPSVASSLFVSNTLVADNGSDGISVFPTSAGVAIQVVLNRVEANNNGNNGIDMDASRGANLINATASDCVAAGNVGIGFNANNSNVGLGANFSLFHCVSSNNGTGIGSNGQSSDVTLSQILLGPGNATLLQIVNNGVMKTFGDNYAAGCCTVGLTNFNKF